MNLRKVFTPVLCCMAVALCGILSTIAEGGVIAVDDTFPTDGPLVTQVPSPGPGAAWANHSGSGSFIQVVGGEVVLTHGGGSREDANSAFAVQTGGILNYAFDMSVDDLSVPITAGDPEYFASFRATGGATSLPGRLFVDAPTGAGDFSIGISTRSGTPDVLAVGDFSYDTDISISVDYDLDNNQAFLSVDGAAAVASTLEGTDGTAIESFAFRQSNSASDETVRVDNLVVMVPVPEPTTVVLMFAGLLGIAARRNR